MSRKLREFHAVQFMSFLPAKNGCPYGLFCVVKCHEITFRLEPACQQSWFFYFLHFHEEPLWPWPIVAISHRGFISFLEIAEMGEKYAAVKEAQTQSADRAEWAVVLCSGVQTSCLWFLESLQIQNDTNVCCFFMGTNHLGSCSVKKKFDVQTMQRMHIAMELSQIFSTTKCVGFCVYKEFIEEKQPQVHLLTSMDTQAHHYFEKCQKRFRNQSIKAFKV